MSAVLTSLQNPRIKAAVRLRERREREKSGLMLVEGFHELELAVNSGVQPVEVFLAPELLRAGEQQLRQRLLATGSTFVEVSPAVMAKLAYREHPDAWLAVARTPQRELASLALSPRPLLIVAEGIEKPGNLGAILRSADAAGVEAVLLCDRRTDLWNPNVVRASKGTIFRVPVVETTSEAAQEWLHRQQIAVLAATPSGEIDYWDADLRGGVAIAVGTEKEGLSPLWLAGAAARVLIPMHGQVNSLNVAQALTLLVYEARRQRR